LLALEEEGTHRLCEQARLERLDDQRLLLAGVPGHLRGRWSRRGCDPARQPAAQQQGRAEQAARSWCRAGRAAHQRAVRFVQVQEPVRSQVLQACAVRLAKDFRCTPPGLTQASLLPIACRRAPGHLAGPGTRCAPWCWRPVRALGRKGVAVSAHMRTQRSSNQLVALDCARPAPEHAESTQRTTQALHLYAGGLPRSYTDGGLPGAHLHKHSAAD